MRRLYIRFKSLVNDFVYSFGRAALLLLVEVQNHTVPVRERRRIRDMQDRMLARIPPFEESAGQSTQNRIITENILLCISRAVSYGHL